MLRVPRSKIAVPVVPSGSSSRPELLNKLEQAKPEHLLLLSAPAGYGKTLLLADWVGRDGRPTAWVSLDREDDAPRLWSAIVSAIAALPLTPPNGSLLLAGQNAHVTPGDLIDHLVELIEAVNAPLRLILDDVHKLTAGEPLRDLARLVRHRPANLHLVLSSRADPPFSLWRLRLEGRLRELRADQLRFSCDEAEELLRAAGLDLTRKQAARLHARTEGWAAGLRLAALALRRIDDPEAFIEEFSGDERSMADYLTAELLSGLPVDALDLLRSVSTCTRLSPGLAVTLSTREDAAKLLDELARETGLLERQVSGTYRMHSLLRTYLVANLRRHRPALHRRLHITAARWWSEAGDPEHALLHAERSGDKALIGDFLRRTGVVLLLNGEFGPVRRALDTVGPAVRASDPWLALIAALTHLDERALPAAAAGLRQARGPAPGGEEPGLATLRDSAKLLGRCVGLVDSDGVTMSAPPDPRTPDLDALLSASRGTAELALGGGGDLALARRELDRAVTLARTHGFGFLEVQALCTIALLAASEGDYPGMVRAAEDAIRTSSRCGRHPSAWTARAFAVLAYADLLAGDPTSARRRAANALDRTSDAIPPETLYALRVVHGAALADEGDRTAGLNEMQAARTRGSGMLWPAPVPAALAVLEHRVALLHGNPAAAAEALAWLERRTGRIGEILVAEAGAELVAGRHQAARNCVEPLMSGSVQALLPHTIIEVLLIVTEVSLRNGDLSAGTATLDRALALGEAAGIVRPFVLAGSRTRDVLAGRPATRGSGTFATRFKAARKAVSGDASALLSERELVVLALLPSLLSASEIAAELTVSVNTVKSHIRSIYTKLGASSRRAAVQRAHERGLLTRGGPPVHL